MQYSIQWNSGIWGARHAMLRKTEQEIAEVAHAHYRHQLKVGEVHIQLPDGSRLTGITALQWADARRKPEVSQAGVETTEALLERANELLCKLNTLVDGDSTAKCYLEDAGIALTQLRDLLTPCKRGINL